MGFFYEMFLKTLNGIRFQYLVQIICDTFVYFRNTEISIIFCEILTYSFNLIRIWINIANVKKKNALLSKF